MLEVLFSDSAAGSLKTAMHHGRELGGCFGVIATGADGRPLPPEETARLQREAEEQERRRWAEAGPWPEEAGEVLPFSLGLSMGPIDEPGIGPLRQTTLEQLYAIYPGGRQTAAEMTGTARRRLATLLERAPGEPVRIWTDRTPDAACGLGWVLEQLRPLGFARLDLRLVELPPRTEGPDSGLTAWSLGELHPAQWCRLPGTARPLSPARAAALAARWRALQQEDAPLRAVLNGVLVSAAEELYDPYLRRVLAELPDTFREAELIGLTLGRFPLGFGDAWLAMRVESWVARGDLAVVRRPEPGLPLYHRTLRKTEALQP